MNQSTTIAPLGKLKHTIIPANPFQKLKLQGRRFSPNIKNKLIPYSTERDNSTEVSSSVKPDSRRPAMPKKVSKDSASESCLKTSKLVNLVTECELRGDCSFSILKAVSLRIHKK